MACSYADFLLFPLAGIAGRVAATGCRARRRPVGLGLGLVEAAPDELDEDVLQRWLGLAQRDDVRSEAAQRSDDRTERRVVGQGQVDDDRLARLAGALVRGRDGGEVAE